jgi:formate hydrogenlyase subunit 3/multisubunit Na+/H+ antiporter MnhD subunit
MGTTAPLGVLAGVAVIGSETNRLPFADLALGAYIVIVFALIAAGLGLRAVRAASGGQ